MDPFPFDYKIGAILPIAIILVYPLIGFFKFSFISWFSIISFIIPNFNTFIKYSIQKNHGLFFMHQLHLVQCNKLSAFFFFPQSKLQLPKRTCSSSILQLICPSVFPLLLLRKEPILFRNQFLRSLIRSHMLHKVVNTQILLKHNRYFISEEPSTGVSWNKMYLHQ